ncbi:exodeoxyribonuclease V alpha subunit [Gammaproteobacteria bacterium]
MSNTLYELMKAGGLPPLSYYFARFIAKSSKVNENSMLAQSAALVSVRNLQGDVCVDLGQFAGKPLFDESSDGAIAVPCGPEMENGEKRDVVLRGPFIEEWLETLNGACLVGKPPNAQAPQILPLILENRRLYLGKFWQFEKDVADALRSRRVPIVGLNQPLLTHGLGRLFPSVTSAVDWQKVAAAIAVSRRFAVISGGPGTGKTTTIVKVLALLLEQDPNLRIALAAPTGKAAARLTIAIRSGKGEIKAKAQVKEQVLSKIPEEASTIHRLLGMGFDNRSRYNSDNPLLIDCLVVDEASMIDLTLMARLLAELPENTRILLLGDRDQLPSVEAGNVFGDITGLGRKICYTQGQVNFLELVGAAPKGELKPSTAQPPRIEDAVGLLLTNYRFGPSSGIGALSDCVKGGCVSECNLFAEFDDLAWLEAPSEDRLHTECISWAVERYACYLRRGDIAEALRSFEQFGYPLNPRQ